MFPERPFTLNRRRGLALLGGLLTLPWSLRALADGTGDPPVARLARALGPLASVDAIGRAYLTQPAMAFDAGAAVEALTGRLHAQGIEWRTASTRRLARGLADLVEADLRDGRVVTVDGWLLARTEAEVCALYAGRT